MRNTYEHQSVSDGKIQITILILRRGPCLNQPSSVVSSEFSPRILISYPSTSPRAFTKLLKNVIIITCAMNFSFISPIYHLCHVFFLSLSLHIKLVAVACHSPLQPVLWNVLPVPVVKCLLTSSKYSDFSI